jgi:hypothetical protein
MTSAKFRHAIVAALLFGAPAAAIAQPYAGPDSGDYADHYDASISGEPVASVDVFYDQLSPYGAWVDEPGLRQRVFIPEQAQFVPYTDGHWQYTSVGFVWISSHPFDWATSHYGRWVYSRPYGRWAWLPDTQWGPSWVEWRESGDDFGWAPLAPQIAIEIGYAPPPESWHYCAAAHVLDPDPRRYYVPASRVVEIHRSARPIEHYAQISGARVVVGPSAAVLHAHQVAARPTKIVQARAIGRLQPAEAQVAVKHAEEHRAVYEQQNKQRIERTPALRQVEVKAAASAPPRQPPPAQAKPQPPAAQPRPEARPPEHAQPAQVRPPEHGQPQPAQVRPPEHGQPQPAQVKRPEPAQAEPRPEAQPEHAQPHPQPAPPVQVKRPEPTPVQPRPPTQPHSEPAQPRPEPRPPVNVAPAPRAPEPRQPTPHEQAPRQPAPSQPQRSNPRAEPAGHGRPEAPARKDDDQHH